MEEMKFLWGEVKVSPAMHFVDRCIPAGLGCITTIVVVVQRKRKPPAETPFTVCRKPSPIAGFSNDLCKFLKILLIFQIEAPLHSAIKVNDGDQLRLMSVA
jgi:hypothetical protein